MAEVAAELAGMSAVHEPERLVTRAAFGGVAAGEVESTRPLQPVPRHVHYARVELLVKLAMVYSQSCTVHIDDNETAYQSHIAEFAVTQNLCKRMRARARAIRILVYTFMKNDYIGCSSAISCNSLQVPYLSCHIVFS